MGRRSAALYHARERRASLGAFPDLFVTHRYAIPTATIPAASFPAGVLDLGVTFRTAIRIVANVGTHQGLLFEIGDGTTAIAAWVDDDQIGFRAGDALAADRGLASFTTGSGELPIGRTFTLLFAALPGNGRVRIWDQGGELARGAASGGSMPNGWAASSDGAFAAAASGALPADVARTGAPNGFEVVAPLEVFVGQLPRKFA